MGRGDDTYMAGGHPLDAQVKGHASDGAAFAGGGAAVTDVLARAFRDNPMNKAVLRRSPEARVRANRLGARLLLGLAEITGHVFVAESTSGATEPAPLLTGALIGFGPDRPPPPGPSLAQAGLLLRQGIGATIRWGAVQSALGDIRPVDRHWTLSMIGVAPEAQGGGVGRGLVARWVEGIATQPAPAWVETDRPELVAFYRQFGFEPEARRVVHGVEVTGLRRPAP